ncbi:MAG: CRISPR-associated helicase Cas3' [Anaerolineales bacterium]|nr:CRISPR-associated helicase Cas3' [Anaerolineales bacterium]
MTEIKPYDYQMRVAKNLLAGKSVVLQAPTGAGKTFAALLPYLHAFREETDENFPSKCIYIVPMRVLAHQFIEKTQEYLDSFQRRFRQSIKVRIQTGDQQDDREFESDLIFCTVDQFLSSYLMMPYSLSRRMANLNAGAMVGSYLVFDEFHLLDPGSTLPTALYILKQLSQLAPVLMMTATFSSDMLKTLADYIKGEIVLVSPEETYAIQTRGGTVSQRQRAWYTASELLNADAVLSAHQRRSLVLCNTVRRAQGLYRELVDMIQDQELDIEVLLLHSRFLPDDRKRIEERLRSEFGERASGRGSRITIATQTIEVGVDITSEILHMELAPASALIQRAGRCARYPGEYGKVIVYPVEHFSPYGKEARDSEADPDWVKEMKAAFTWLQERQGQVFDFGFEQEFINAVATPRDRKILLELSAGSEMRAIEIQRVLSGDQQSGDRRLVIRDADSRLVLVHSDPDRLLAAPYSATGFNLPTRTLYAMVREWLERDIDVDWRVRRLDEETDRDEDNQPNYGWSNLNDTSLLSASQVLVVHPDLAGYDPHEGFLADRGGTGFLSGLPVFKGRTRQWERSIYCLEAYEEHIQRVLEAFREIALPEMRFPARSLEQAAGWPAGSVLQAGWLVCLFHDVGKLSQGWQSWARAYQRQVGNPIDKGFSAAHTDNDWQNEAHKAAAKKIRGKYPRPRHAGESAYATAPIIIAAFGKELGKAILTAIVRHHAPFTAECRPYALEKQAKEHIDNTLKAIPLDLQARINLDLLLGETRIAPSSFANYLVMPYETNAWLAYLLLARALRRSDQLGTARGAQL